MIDWKQALDFANRDATQDNPVLQLLYALTYPLALLAKRLGISANTLTALSLLTGLLAFFFLVFDQVVLFLVMWLFSYILDLVDGTVARMTKKINTLGVDIDHLSDMLKIPLVFIGFGVFYSSQTVWVLASLAVLALMSWETLRLSISQNEKAATLESVALLPLPSLKSFTQEKLKSIERLKQVIKRNAGLRVVTKLSFAIHLHTFLWFFVMPFSSAITVFFFSYVVCLVVVNSVHLVWSTHSSAPRHCS